MKKLLKSRRGFSLTEAIIAMAVILIVSLTAITIIMSSMNSKHTVFDQTRAQYFAESSLECFKSAEDKSEFAYLLSFVAEEDTLTSKNNDYTYTSKKDNFKAKIHADFDTGVFEIEVTDKRGDELVSFNYRRGDLT